MFLKIAPEIFPILIPILCIFIPVVILAVVVFIIRIKNYTKSVKRNNRNSGIDYEAYFGGSDNIANIEIKMSRVNVTVNDLEKVDFDKLKEQNMGVLVVGNVIKCASAEFVSIVERNLSGK